MLIHKAPGSYAVAPELRDRLRWLFLALVIAFSILAGRLWQLQVMRGERYYERALSNLVQTQYIHSVRGKILDMQGQELATNRPAFNLYAVEGVPDTEAVGGLRDLLDLKSAELAKIESRIDRARKRGIRDSVLLLEDQGRERAALLAQAKLRLPGFEVRDEPYRVYPKGDLAAHVVGYMNQLTQSELERLQPDGYDASDFIGRHGVERQWESYLRGRRGKETFVVNARGERIEDDEAKRLISGPAFEKPIPGHNVYLTLDSELQGAVEKIVSRHPAAAVVMVDVHTGKIRAIASSPRFNPNTMTGHLTRAEEKQLLEDPRKPFLDKTLRQHYPPGSTYKFVVALAALQDGIVGEEELLECPGRYEQGHRTFRCTSRHKEIDMISAVQHSCNVYFWKLSEKMKMNRLAELATEFGFGVPTGLGLNGDLPGRVPTREWYEQRDVYKVGYKVNAAVGQGDVETTVVQLAMAYAAIANGGNLYVPQLLERVVSADGDLVLEHGPKLRRKINVSTQNFDILKRGMWKAVNELGGTIFEHGRSEILAYSGKSGTAQVRARSKTPGEEVTGWDPRREHAWFAGFAPSENPEVALVVLVEHGGSGGKVAGPVARSIFESYFQSGRRAPPR